MLDGLLRADDVSMKTTEWLSETGGLIAGVHFIGMRPGLTEGENPRSVPSKKVSRYQ